ncbi:hypothetical protein [Xanthomonas campestris]|uniref:hypothetical protein n=1 Tax=Xanthomonas campestris TaxID=339 RepID=UPI0015F2539C|nr:hypothetical protein [Xanthomonas campestris]
MLINACSKPRARSPTVFLDNELHVANVTLAVTDIVPLLERHTAPLQRPPALQAWQR